MNFEIGLILFLLIWFSPIAWVWFTDHKNKKYITVMTIFMGAVGFLISLLIIGHKEPKEPELGEEGVYKCNHCSTLYRLSDYRTDAKIICNTCSKEIPRPF